MTEPYISNSELFRELRKDVKYLRKDISDVRTELKTTQEAVKQYNGLRESLEDCKGRIQKIETQSQAKASVGQSFREWGGWAIGAAMFIITIYTLIKTG